MNPFEKPESGLIETPFTSHWLGDDGVLRNVAKPTKEPFDLKAAKTIIKANKELIKGQKRPILGDLREVGPVSREFRNEITASAADQTLAVALVTKTNISKIVANLILFFNKPPVDVKSFSNPNEALLWCYQYLDKKRSQPTIDKKNSLTVNCGKILSLGNDVLCLEMIAQQNISEVDANELLDAYEKLNSGKKCKLLIFTNSMIGATKEAREAFRSKRSRALISAIALIVPNAPFFRFFTNLIMRKTQYFPVRSFRAKQEGLAWLANIDNPDASEEASPQADEDKLFSALSRFSEQNFSELIDIGTVSEKWRNMAAALNMFGEEIQELVRKLKKNIEFQDQIVKKRTKELQNANRALIKHEAQIKSQANRLLISNKELEQFAYVASHDLQEPLRMVAGFMTLLEDEYKEKLNEEALEYIHFATDGARRMQNIIEDLLSFSRVNKNERILSSVDINQIIATICKDFSVLLTEKGATISTGTMPAIWADSPRIDQVLRNLIGNGLKFNQNKAPVVHVDAKQDGNEWVFSVKDNGIGIDKKFQEKIFMIFQRLHKKEEYGGTGIGLALCKKIVGQFSGRMWVESSLNKGSVFHFTVPIERDIHGEEDVGSK